MGDKLETLLSLTEAYVQDLKRARAQVQAQINALKGQLAQIDATIASAKEAGVEVQDGVDER